MVLPLHHFFHYIAPTASYNNSRRLEGEELYQEICVYPNHSLGDFKKLSGTCLKHPEIRPSFTFVKFKAQHMMDLNNFVPKI